MCPEVELTGLGSFCLSEREGVPRMCVGGTHGAWSGDVSIYCVISFFRRLFFFKTVVT